MIVVSLSPWRQRGVLIDLDLEIVEWCRREGFYVSCHRSGTSFELLGYILLIRNGKNTYIVHTNALIPNVRTFRHSVSYIRIPPTKFSSPDVVEGNTTINLPAATPTPVAGYAGRVFVARGKFFLGF